MAKHFTKAQRAEIEKQLLAGARKLFLAQGIRAMSIDSLCANVRVSKGTFYSFFESKYDLFLAITEAQEKAVYDKFIIFTERFIGGSSDYAGQLFDLIHENYMIDPIMEIACRPHEFEKFLQKVSQKRWDEYWEFGFAHCHTPLAKCAITGNLMREIEPELLQEMVALIGQIATRRQVIPPKRYTAHIAHLRDLFIFKLTKTSKDNWL